MGKVLLAIAAGIIINSPAMAEMKHNHGSTAKMEDG